MGRPDLEPTSYKIETSVDYWFVTVVQEFERFIRWMIAAYRICDISKFSNWQAAGESWCVEDKLTSLSELVAVMYIVHPVLYMYIDYV